MKVPTYIKKAILATSRASKIAHKNGEIVRSWLERNNLLEQYEDSFIDYCEYSNDAGNILIEELEKEGD